MSKIASVNDALERIHALTEGESESLEKLGFEVDYKIEFRVATDKYFFDSMKTVINRGFDKPESDEE